MANNVRFPRMAKVICDRKPASDILTRQPKSPGQKAVYSFTPPGKPTYTINTLLVPDMPTEVWANQTGNKEYVLHRCTKCSSVAHSYAK